MANLGSTTTDGEFNWIDTPEIVGDTTVTGTLTANSGFDAGSSIITNVAAPSAASDAARKSEVDTVQSNLDSHEGDTTNPHSVTASQANAVPTSDKGSAGGVAELDADALVPTTQLPSLAITETNVVADETERLALTDIQEGDVAVQQDEPNTYIFLGGDPSLNSNWEKMSAAGQVTTVFGRSGDITAQSGDYTHAQIGSVSSDDHHIRFGNDAADSLADIPNRDHSSLNNIGASDHHVRFGDAAGDSIADIPNRDHSSLNNIGSADHHSKTSSFAEIDDTNVADLTIDTQANRPTAGTSNRLYVESDSHLIQYDDGTNWQTVGVSDHSQLSGIGSADHHAKYTDEEAQDAVGTITDGTLAYDDANNTLGVASNSISTTELSFDTATQSELDSHAGTASAHHSKTSSLTELSDTNAVELTIDTNANRPAAGTTDRLFVESDSGQILRDNGTSWDTMGVSDHSQLSGVGSADHHSRYADSEAVSAVDGEVSAAASSVSGLDSTVDSHQTNTSNPHSVTASQVGAVPDSGGTFSGNVTVNGENSVEVTHLQEVAEPAAPASGCVRWFDSTDLAYKIKFDTGAVLTIAER